MPLFSRREPTPEPVYAPEPEPAKKHGFFHRRDPSPVGTTTNQHTRGSGSVVSKTSSMSSTGSVDRSHRHSQHASSTGSGGLFHRSSEKKTSISSGGGSGGGLLHRRGERDLDPSILQAREHVMNAEAAEAEADRALHEARMRAREAREHVKRLEEEAKEDARRAKIKQEQAREVSKRGKGLGRKLILYYSLFGFSFLSCLQHEMTNMGEIGHGL